MAKEFSKKDAKYDKKPKSALPRKQGEPDQYDDHNYKDREIRPDGSTVYYYDNGVKAIHHPKADSHPRYHKSAARHHLDETSTTIDSAKYKEALSHLRALSGHSQALDKFKEKENPVDKLAKEFSGTVAVASDPAVFTRTYSGNNKKGQSGVAKLDKYLKKNINNALTTLLTEVRKELKEEDVQIEKETYIVPELEKTIKILKDDSVDFFENTDYDEDESDE